MKPTTLLSFLIAFVLFLPQQISAQITTPTAGKTYYIIHTSGNVVARNTDDRTIIQTYSGSGDQRIEFVSDGAGYYMIKIVGQAKYMSLSGSWNTFFIASPTDESKWTIEKVSSNYVTFKCKANGKYLGTDNINSGSSIFSDKSGTDSKHFWFISEQFTTPPVDTRQYSISPNAVYDKPFEGWGVSLCWWANMCGKWSDAKIDEIVDWLVSPNGLNYNIFRYNIGGGDDPQNRNCTLHHMANGKGIRAEMDGFKSASNAAYDWSKDAAQRKIMLKIKAKRPDAIFEAFSNSAPYYMTYSGCCAGNTDASQDNLKPEFYTEFANYLVDVCKYYKQTYNIEFKTLDPFNEPVTNYWGANGGQEGCHFSTAAQINFLKILSPILKQSGLKTVISTADETSVAQQVADLKSYVSSNILNIIGQINTHTYTADNMSRANLRALCSNYNMPLWMSEVGQGGTGISGNLNLAQKLMNDIHYLRPEAWVDWQYMEEGNDQWCLIMGNFSNQTYSKIKNYYVRQQMSRYILKGYRFVFVPSDQMLAALSPGSDSLVIVTLNNSATKMYHKIDLAQFKTIGKSIKATRTSETENNANVSDFALTDKSMLVNCPGYSITTLVVPVTTATITKTLKTGVPYLIISRSSNQMMQNEGTSVEINNYEYGDSTQMWKLTSSGNGYIITTLKGKILTDDGSYFSFASDVTANGQVFTLQNLGDDTYKITSTRTGKSLDLQGESNAAGTKIGVYDYGTSPAVAHRQWLLYELPTIEKPITQTISMIKGWNLISINVMPDTSIVGGRDKACLVSTVFAGLDVQTIKTMSSFWRINQPEYLNSLQTIIPGEGYLVYMNVVGTLTVTGIPVETRLIASLQQTGWNLIGYPGCTDAMHCVSIPFSNYLNTTNCSIIKNFDGFWIPNGVMNSIQDFEPGKGYFLKK